STDFGAGSFFVNAAEGELRGLQIEPVLQATDDLRLRLGVSYVDSEFTSFPDAVVQVPTGSGGNVTEIQDAGGNRFPRAPELSANLSADYSKDFAAGTLAISGAVMHQSDWFVDNGNRFRAPESTILNAQISW